MLIYNCRVLIGENLLDPGWIKIQDGKIVDFGSGSFQGDINGCGAFLFPGLVDFHNGIFQGWVYPHPGTSMPIQSARICHETLCLKSGITTVLNTISLSDIALWSESNVMFPDERQSICELLPELKEGPNHFIHLRCDLAWSEIVPESISFLSQYKPLIVSFFRCCVGAGRFIEPEIFKTYIRQRWRGNILEVSDSFFSSRNPGDKKMWKRAENIIKSLMNKKTVLCIHDPNSSSDILTASELKIQVAEFPVNYAAIDEANRHKMAICMSSPNVLRGGSQYGNLSTSEVWNNNKIDILTSDYYPNSLLEAVFILSRDSNGTPSLQQLVKSLCSVTQTPADILGLKSKGKIDKNKDADLVLVKLNYKGLPEVEMTIVGGIIRYCRNPKNMISRHK